MLWLSKLSWVRRDGDDKDVCYIEIYYLRGHFAKNCLKMLSRILIKYLGEVFIQTILKRMMNEDVYLVAVPVINFIIFTSFICFRVLFKGLFLL
jgi:hypothetical protein